MSTYHYPSILRVKKPYVNLQWFVRVFALTTSVQTADICFSNQPHIKKKQFYVHSIRILGLSM